MIRRFSGLVFSGLGVLLLFIAVATPSVFAVSTSCHITSMSLCDTITLTAPVLLNPQPLPPGISYNISLTLTLTGNATDLEGTLAVVNNTSSAPTSPLTIVQRACKASVTGQVIVTSSVAAPGPSNVAIVVTGVFEPPNPCLAAQGFSVSVEWYIFPGSVTLTTRSVTGAAYQWTGYGSGVFRLNPQPLPPG